MSSDYIAHEEDGDGDGAQVKPAVELTNDDGAATVSHHDIQIRSNELGNIEEPSAESLHDPAHAGYLMKRGVKLGCYPTWKRRYFILKGSYIFKFESPLAKRPKGVPIPVLGAQCTIGPVDPSAGALYHKHTMVLSTLRKEYIIGAETESVLREWIDAIAKARSLTIKQELGHAPQSDSERFANRAGAYLTDKRLEREVEEADETRRMRFEG